MLGLHSCVGFFLAAVSWGSSPAVVRRLLSAAASLAEHGLSGTQAAGAGAPGLWGTGSIFVVQGLSCSKACGIFPDQGSILCILHWQVDPLRLSHQGSPRRLF